MIINHHGQDVLPSYTDREEITDIPQGAGHLKECNLVCNLLLDVDTFKSFFETFFLKHTVNSRTLMFEKIFS